MIDTVKECSACTALNAANCSYALDTAVVCKEAHFLTSDNKNCCLKTHYCKTCTGGTDCDACETGFKIVSAKCELDTAHTCNVASECNPECKTCGTDFCDRAKCLTCTHTNHSIIKAERPTSGTTWPTNGTCSAGPCPDGYSSKNNPKGTTGEEGEPSKPDFCIPCSVKDCKVCPAKAAGAIEDECAECMAGFEVNYIFIYLA